MKEQAPIRPGHPELPEEVTMRDLMLCPECLPFTRCESALLFQPDLGAVRVHFCPKHGVVSSRSIVSTGRAAS